MQHQYRHCYDYCDTYDSYGSGLSLYDKNSVKTFSCNECKQTKFILKKSVNDPKFKCEECIQKKEASASATSSVSTTNLQNLDVVLNMPLSSSFQASSAMLTADGMYQQYQPYQLQTQQEQQTQESQQQQQPTFNTVPQFSWRWFNFFV